MLYQSFSAIAFSLEQFCVIFIMTKIAFYNLETARLRAIRIKNVLMCQHANVPWVLTCSRVNVPCVLECPRTNVSSVLTC